MNSNLTILKDNIYGDDHIAFLRVVRLQNDGYDIVIRHLKPLPNQIEPTLEITGEPRDLGLIKIEYQSIADTYYGKNFILKFNPILNETSEEKLDEFLAEQSRMIKFAQDTIQNIRDILKGTEMEHYICKH